MRKLQIIAEKPKNLTLNADLSQSMTQLSSERLLCEAYWHQPNITLTASKHWISGISLFSTKSKKMGTYRRRQTRRHLSDFLCLQGICTWKTVYFISIYIRKDQPSNEHEILFPPSVFLVFQYLGVSKWI